jgi:hypothetical protein
VFYLVLTYVLPKGFVCSMRKLLFHLGISSPYSCDLIFVPIKEENIIPFCPNI